MLRRCCDLTGMCAADVNLIMPHVPHIMAFIEQIAEDQEHPDAVVGATCGLIGSVLSVSKVK